MGFGYFFFLVYLTFCGAATVLGLPLPFSMPPLPEEPALLRMVPKDAMWAFTWAGAAVPDPNSKNRTEQLCAEPEVRALVDALQTATLGMLTQELGATGSLAKGTFELAVAALQQPGCVFVRSMQRTPQKKLEGGLALRLGDHLGVGKTLLGGLAVALKAQLRGADAHDDLEVDDVRFRALPIAVDHSFVGWAEVDGWLLVAVGEAMATQLVHGLRDQDQGLRGEAAFARLLEQTAVARPAIRTFVDGDRMVAALAEFVAPTATDVARALGITKGMRALSTAGLDGNGYAARIQFETPQPGGLLAAFAGEPIGQDGLMAIPVDADLALALRIDPLQLEHVLLQLAGAVSGGGAASEYEAFQREFADHLHVAWRDDLVLQLDGQIAIWNAPSQGGLGGTAATGCFGVRDDTAFAATWAKVMAALATQMPAKARLRAGAERGRLQRGGAFLESFVHQGHTVHWIDVFDDDVWVASSFAATPQGLVAGLSPAAVRATLDALDAPNPDRALPRLPEVGKRGRATALLYIDLQRLLTSTWPMVTMLIQANGREWQHEGFDFDSADLPRLTALTAHLGREVQRLEPTEHGFAYTRTGTLPVIDLLTVAALATIGTVAN